MKIKVLQKPGLVLPSCAHESDAGADLVAMSEPTIIGTQRPEAEAKYLPYPWESIDYIEYDTQLQIEPKNDARWIPHAFVEEGEEQDQYGKIVVDRYAYVLIYPRSSLSKYNLLLCNATAIVDASFRGNIKLRFKYIFQPNDLNVWNGWITGRVDQTKIFHKEDRIAQAVAAWKEPIEWEWTDKLGETKRGEGGFGSTNQ